MLQMEEISPVVYVFESTASQGELVIIVGIEYQIYLVSEVF